jgi:putative phosphoesterase
MLVGVVSDTHDDVQRAERAADFFDGRVPTVVHCGDVVAPFTAAPFDREAFDFHAVRGNNDGEWGLADAVDDFGTYHGEFAELRLDGAATAVYHGTAEPLVDALVDCGDYEFVFRGHTHQRVDERRGGTLHLNPGGLPFPGVDEEFTVAVVDTEDGSVEFENLDA